MSVRLAVALLTALVQLRGAATQQLRGSMATASSSSAAAPASLNSSSIADESGVMAAAGFPEYQVVTIGPTCNSYHMCQQSHYNRKCVKVDAPYHCDVDAGDRWKRLNNDWPDATDRFEITTPDATHGLFLVCAQRVDNHGGWSMDLKISCRSRELRQCCFRSVHNCQTYDPYTHSCCGSTGGCNKVYGARPSYGGSNHCWTCSYLYDRPLSLHGTHASAAGLENATALGALESQHAGADLEATELENVTAIADLEAQQASANGFAAVELENNTTSSPARPGFLAKPSSP